MYIGASIAPALLQTSRVCLCVSRAAEDSSIGRAVMALVCKEPLVEGGGGGGGGGGRGNYVVPLAVVTFFFPLCFCPFLFELNQISRYIVLFPPPLFFLVDTWYVEDL